MASGIADETDTRQIGTINDTCQYRHLLRRINDATTTEREECSGIRSVNKLNTRSTTAWAEMYASYEGLITYSRDSVVVVGGDSSTNHTFRPNS